MVQFRRLLLCGVSLLAGLAAQVTSAGVNSLTRFGPYGGSVLKVAYHPANPSIVYATTSAGFYRSIDGGVTWQIVNDRIPNQANGLAVHPSQPNLVFVATSASGVFASTDAGGTLTVQDSSRNIYASGAPLEYSADGSVLYVSTGRQLYRTTNHGATWQPGGVITSATDTLVENLAVDPTDANRLYVTMHPGGGFQSADGGTTWQPWAVPAGLINDIAIANTQPLRIWVAGYGGTWFTDDRGTNWTSASTIPSTAIALDRNDPNIVYSGGMQRGLLVSRDNGATWSEIQNGAHTGIINCITPHPTDPNRLFVAGRAGLAFTSTAGNTWAARNQGIDGLSANELVSAAASDRIYINSLFDGVYVIDPESSATVPANNASLQEFGPNLGFYGLGMSVVSGENDRLFLAASESVVRSLDGGNSWSQHRVGPDGLYRVASVSADGSRLLGTGTNGVYISTDGGDSWAVGPSLAARDLVRAESAPSNPQVVYMSGRVPNASNDIILRSPDGGDTWTTHDFPEANALSIAIDPSNEQTLYVGGSGKVLKSTDGARTWTAQTVVQAGNGIRALAIDPQNPRILYAGGLSYIARSVDAGASWQQVFNDTERLFDIRSIAVDPLRPHSVYVAMSGKGVRQIEFAPDLGITATVADLPTPYGTVASYSYRISNAGPFDATNVRARIELPAGVTNIEAAGPGTTCTVAGTIVTCVAPVVRTNGGVDIVIDATHPAAGNVTVVGTVEGDQPDHTSDNNRVVSNATIAEVTDLSVTLTGPTGILGRTLPTALTLRVTNAGPNVASMVSVRLELAAGVEFSTFAPNDGTVSCIRSTNTVVCTVPQIAVGATVMFSIYTANINTAGTYTHMATVTASGTDLGFGNNVASAVTTVGEHIPGSGANTPSFKGGGRGGGGSTSLWMIAALFLLSRMRTKLGVRVEQA